MTEPLHNLEDGRLAANSRMYRPDPQLDKAADMFEQDREAWERLHPTTRDLSLIHLDLRNLYRAAVRARLVPADRGPAA